MKTMPKNRWSSRWTSILSLCLLHVILARADNTNQIFQDGYYVDKYNIIWGEAANGIKAGVKIHYNEYSPVWVTMHLHRSGETLPYSFPGTSNSVTNDMQLAPLYLDNTNSFCGPVELKDADGKVVPMIKPDVSLTESYPDRLSWMHLCLLNAPHTIAPGYRGPDFLTDGTDTKIYQVNGFFLTNYFKMGKTGEYKLTIWPKVYKQSEKDKDLYQRIDIPPVKATIKWTGN